MKILIMGTLFGLLFGLLLAFLRDFLDDRIKSEDDIVNMDDYPLLAVIPHMKKDSEGMAVLNSPKSGVAEAFRSLRTNLQFMGKAKRAHVIALTSTVGGEGKTTFVLTLAES